MSADDHGLLTFDVGLDGTVQNLAGDAVDLVPEKHVLHRLLCAARKTLITEDIASVTITCDEYVLRLSATGLNFRAVITAVGQ